MLSGEEKINEKKWKTGAQRERKCKKNNIDFMKKQETGKRKK